MVFLHGCRSEAQDLKALMPSEVSTRIAGTGARVDVAVVPKGQVQSYLSSCIRVMYSYFSGGMESLAESSFNYRQLNFGPLTASILIWLPQKSA